MEVARVTRGVCEAYLSKIKCRSSLSIDLPEKAQVLHMGLVSLIPGQNLSSRPVEGGKQGDGPVANVIMRACPDAGQFSGGRASWVRSKAWHRRFLVHRASALVGWIRLEADYVPELLRRVRMR